jgi:hypothetical protein
MKTPVKVSGVWIQGPNPGYLEYGVFLENGTKNPHKNRVRLLTGISMD